MGIVFAVIGVSFLYPNMFNKRMTGVETGGDVLSGGTIYVLYTDFWRSSLPFYNFKVRDAWVGFINWIHRLV